jgi:DNA-binding response OmpR family regulator
MRVLLVEDDLRFATALTAALRRSGYHVDHSPTAAAALAAAPHDLVLLDLGLPDADGLDVCRRLRQHSEVAIIMLTARGEEQDRVTGLRCGADDYVVKPFGFAELQARIEAVLRRVRPRPAGVHVVGDLRVDLDRHHAYLGAKPIPLTRKEFELLAVLAAQPEVAVRREQLIEEVWHTSWRGTSRTLDVHMATLRSKIGVGAQIQTIRGVGYRLVAGDRMDLARPAAES